MPAANVIQLRQLLREKMPELRLSLEELPSQRQHHWPTGLPQIDGPLHGGLPKGALTEIVATRRGAGSALLMKALLTQAAHKKEIVALVDGHDSFDVTAVEENLLARLLWVRCHSAEESLKAADLLLRDQNVPLVLLDLIANPVMQVRRIQASTWFRFQRIAEQGSTVCVVLTPQLMVSPAQARITLPSVKFSLETLEHEPEEVLAELKPEVSDARRVREIDLRRHSSA
jgi:hypothetical protein